MAHRIHLPDCSLGFLAAMALSLARDIDCGETDKRDLLEQVMAQVPTAPEYCVDHRKRR